MNNIQELRTNFISYKIPPFEWLGDSPSRFDSYTEYAKDCKSILELGVYSGLSTAAFLAAKPKSLTSIDITDKFFSSRDTVAKIANDLGVDYRFIIMNDLDYISDGHDLLFIDTTHTYEQTIAELNVFGQLTNKRIILHDFSSFHGVYRAVNEWLWTNKNFHISHHDSRGDGVVVLERYAGV